MNQKKCKYCKYWIEDGGFSKCNNEKEIGDHPSLRSGNDHCFHSNSFTMKTGVKIEEEKEREEISFPTAIISNCSRPSIGPRF